MSDFEIPAEWYLRERCGIQDWLADSWQSNWSEVSNHLKHRNTGVLFAP